MKFTNSQAIGRRVEIVISDVSPMESSSSNMIGAYDDPVELIADLYNLLAKAYTALGAPNLFPTPPLGPLASPEEAP